MRADRRPRPEAPRSRVSQGPAAPAIREVGDERPGPACSAGRPAVSATSCPVGAGSFVACWCNGALWIGSSTRGTPLSLRIAWIPEARSRISLSMRAERSLSPPRTPNEIENARRPGGSVGSSNVTVCNGMACRPAKWPPIGPRTRATSIFPVATLATKPREDKDYSPAARKPDLRRTAWWAGQDSNLQPFDYERKRQDFRAGPACFKTTSHSSTPKSARIGSHRNDRPCSGPEPPSIRSPRRAIPGPRRIVTPLITPRAFRRFPGVYFSI
jgi:hypothetical protein